MAPGESIGRLPTGTTPMPPVVDVEPPAQSTVSVDDLRRNGKIAIWPYIMRELPLSPVEALRLEMRSRERQGRSTTTGTGKDALHRGGVKYFRARLTADEADEARAPESKQMRGLRSGSDLEALRDQLAEVQRLEHFLLKPTYGSHPAVRRETTGDRAHTLLQSKSGSDTEIQRLGVGKGYEDRRLNCDRRPMSSEQRRRPPRKSQGRPVSSLSRRATSDHVECPLGCGEEVRVQDLAKHETSLCLSRYVSCLMPGCTELVQAGLLEVHLRRDCTERRRHRILAEKGKTLDAETSCNACNERLLRRHLRVHRTDECEMRMVQCPNPGCMDKVHAKSLAAHRSVDCATARRTAALNEQAASKPTEEECPKCHETVNASLFRTHTTDECPMRMVVCPNRNLGCGEELLAADIPSHLRKQCTVEIDRNERASRYRLRRQRVQCSGCGYMVVLQHLPRHHREKCPNRRVPCKHWELGCPAMLRLSAMDEHLKVDRLLDARSCLVFDAGRSYIELKEDDRKPPWTAEVWIWRPGLVEGTREKARTALKALWEFQQARRKLAATEKRLAMLEPLLADAATRLAKEQSREAEQARDKVTDEMIGAASVRDDAKVELVISIILLSNSLASAMRGIEELTKQDRLRGFYRLALGSAPWYATAPGRPKAVSRVPGSELGRDGVGQGSNRTPLLEGPPSLRLQETQGGSHVVFARTEIGAEGNRSPGMNSTDVTQRGGLGESPNAGSEERCEEAKLDSGKSNELLEPGGVAVSSGDISSKRKGEEDVGSVLSNAAQENEIVHQALGEASQQSEAAFWAEWVALDGESLAKQIVRLEGETLPRLKEQAAAITGLAIADIFRASVDGGIEQENVVTDKARGTDHNTKAGSAKKREKQRKAAKKAKRKQKHAANFGINLETRIAEEASKRRGVETLFGSEKASFMLEMGPNDRVGIQIAGEKDQIFNYRCPRERWVHLAFVSDSTGVFLLENGKTASRLRDITVALPMREIGGKETACQCLMQEVRYWGVKRSKEELVAWMHQALPATATNDGLLGYWTFEEGAGDYVNDVTEQRFRARKVGRGLKWVTPETICAVNVGAPPTPSWREQNVCKVELRRGRLAQRGRLHQQYIPCPAGCGESILRRNLRAHAAYRCAMRVVTCSMATCEKRMPAKDLPRHLEEYCTSHGAWVRMAEAGEENQECCSCPYCAETVRRCNLKVHVKYVCQWAKEPCRNTGCAALIPRIRKAEHELFFCEATSAVQRRRRLARARARSKYRRDWAQDEE